MDKLERMVTVEGPMKQQEEQRERIREAEIGAREAWEIVTGLTPAYVDVLDVYHGIHKNEYLVEIDGVRIRAFDSTAIGVLGSHYWDLDERGMRNDDLTLHALDNRKLLKRRRKRLMRRELYTGDPRIKL